MIAGTYRQGPFEFELFRSDTPMADWRLRHHPSGRSRAWRPSGVASIDAFADRNVHLSTSPESGFVKLLTVQRRDATGVHIIARADAAAGGRERVGRQTMKTREEWFDVLRDVFGLPLDHVSSADADVLWERVHATPRSVPGRPSQRLNAFPLVRTL